MSEIKGGDFLNKPESEIKKSWENSFTNPNNHDDDKYCYMVHGLIGLDARIKQKIFLSDIQTSDNSQDIDLLQYPEKVSEKKVISASIVDQNHRTTWGHVGLILDVPYKNIMAAYKEDVSTPFFDINKVKREKVPSVDDILKLTNSKRHNEIILTGQIDDKKVNICGFWTKVDKNGEPIDKFLYRKMRRLSEEKGLPLIKIKED